MATIFIERTSEMNNRLRNYGVYLDGNKIGTIANGETKEFQTTPGTHKLQCKIDWCSSPEMEIDLTENMIKIIKVGGFKNGNWIMPAAFGIACLTFIPGFSQAGTKYLYFFLVPVFIGLVYFITIGRRRYLTLREK